MIKESEKKKADHIFRECEENGAQLLQLENAEKV